MVLDRKSPGGSIGRGRGLRYESDTMERDADVCDRSRLLPPPSALGTPALKTDMRAVVERDPLHCVHRCQWRKLPKGIFSPNPNSLQRFLPPRAYFFYPRFWFGGGRPPPKI